MAAGRFRVQTWASNDQSKREDGEWIRPYQHNRATRNGFSWEGNVKHAKIHDEVYRHSSHVSVKKISMSIFVSNFPNNTTSSDLWRLCDDWGVVVDVYISHRMTKSGKRFGFVRFVRVTDLDKLIANLRTIWIGNFHLFADVCKSVGKSIGKCANESRKQLDDKVETAKEAVSDSVFVVVHHLLLLNHLPLIVRITKHPFCIMFVDFSSNRN